MGHKKTDDSLEATVPYLVRTFQDVARYGLSLFELLLQEAVRRQCITLVSSGNIASAVASLDTAADMAVGIKLFAGSDMQARAQIDLAKECFGFAYEKAGDTSSNDIVSLAMELPKMVKDAAVCGISGASLVVAQAY